MPQDVKHATIASLKAVADGYKDLDIFEKFATLKYDSVEFNVDDSVYPSFKRVDELRYNNTMIRVVHGSKRGVGLLSDAFVGFLPRALYGQQLDLLSFDQESVLTNRTVGDFGKLLSNQKSLRAVVIPRYLSEDPETSKLLSLDGGASKEERVLITRRTTMARHYQTGQHLRYSNAPTDMEYIGKELCTQDVTFSLTMNFPSSAQRSVTQHIFLNCRAPLWLATDLIRSNRIEGAAIRCIAIIVHRSLTVVSLGSLSIVSRYSQSMRSKGLRLLLLLFILITLSVCCHAHHQELPTFSTAYPRASMLFLLSPRYHLRVPLFFSLALSPLAACRGRNRQTSLPASAQI